MFPLIASGANQETTWRDMVRGCSIPRISDFMVEQYQNNTQNETICIKVKWTYSPRKEKWCKTTNWSLMHASWDSSEANNLVDFSDLPSSSRQLLKIDNSRELQYTCGLNASRYHKFQLSFQFRKHHLKYNSHVYFFQRQGNNHTSVLTYLYLCMPSHTWKEALIILIHPLLQCHGIHVLFEFLISPDTQVCSAQLPYLPRPIFGCMFSLKNLGIALTPLTS